MASFVSREFVSFVPPPTVPVGEGDHMLARPVIDALCTAFSGDSLPKLLETTKDIDLTNAAAALLLNLVMLELVNTENVSSLSQNCDEMAHLSTQAVQLICDRSAELVAYASQSPEAAATVDNIGKRLVQTLLSALLALGNPIASGISVEWLSEPIPIRYRHFRALTATPAPVVASGSGTGSGSSYSGGSVSSKRPFGTDRNPLK